MPESDKLLGELANGMRSLGKNFDNMREDQRNFAESTQASHSAIQTSIGDVKASIGAHNERIKANAGGIALIWKFLLASGLIGLIIVGVLRVATL